MRSTYLERICSFLGIAESGKRRFLVCDEMFPDPAMGAGYPRADMMVRALAETGCLVTLAPLFEAPVHWRCASASKELPAQVEIASERYRGMRGVESLLREKSRRFTDLIISRPTTMAEFRPLIDREPNVFKRIDLTYDAEAIFAARDILEAETAGQALSQEEQQQKMRAEMGLCRGVRRVLAVSEPEAATFRTHGHTTFVVGHAAKLAGLGGHQADWEERRDFLFVGAIHGDGGPNYESVLWFLDKVWPQLSERFPSARFVIAGLNHSKRLTECPLPERVVVTKQLPDLSPVYARARVFVAPTRASSGIPLKVVEAAGYGVPVVATSLLARQLCWKVPIEIDTADTPEEFMNACSCLFQDRARWEDQRKAALRRVSREYSQATFSRQLHNALNLRSAGSP